MYYVHRVPGTDMLMLPPNLQHEEDKGDYGTPDPDDDADFEHCVVLLQEQIHWIHWPTSSRSCKGYPLCQDLILLPLRLIASTTGWRCRRDVSRGRSAGVPIYD